MKGGSVALVLDGLYEYVTGGQRDERARMPQHIGIVKIGRRKHVEEPSG